MPTKKYSQVKKSVLDKLKQVSTPTITTQLMSNHGLHNVSLRRVLPIDSSLVGLPALPLPCVTYLCVKTYTHSNI